MKKLFLAVLLLLTITSMGWGQVSVDKARFPIPTRNAITTSATPTPVINSTGPVDFVVTALAGDAVFATPTGNPVPGQILTIYIKDNGAPHALDFTTSTAYVPINVTLPITTSAGKWLYVLCKYNSTASKWHVLAVAPES